MTSSGDGWQVREVTLADSDALASLSAVSADSGRVAFAARYRIPTVEAMLLRRPTAHGVVAIAGDGSLVGQGWVSFGQGRVGPDTRPVALLSALAVHPRWRRRGIAAALTRWRLSLIDEHGPGAVVVAAIQAGNTASEANARTWATQVLGDLAVTPTPVRRRPPRREPGLIVRSARLDVPQEVEQIVDGANRSTSNQLLAPPVSADTLMDGARTHVGESRLHRHFVVTDQAGRVLAGLGVEYEALLYGLEITYMPAALRVASRALGVLPPDGVLRNLNVRQPWTVPGGERPGRYLWQTLRWQLRDNGTTLVTVQSAGTPAERAFATPRWAPRTSLRIVARSPEPLPVGAQLGVII